MLDNIFLDSKSQPLCWVWIWQPDTGISLESKKPSAFLLDSNNKAICLQVMYMHSHLSMLWAKWRSKGNLIK